jgi:DNA-binding MarR family transcriptional regulator
MSAPDSLSSNIVYLCGEFAHRMHQMLTKSFKEHRILVTVEQFSVLALLFYQDGINQQDISTMLGRDKTTITRVISIMERDELIKRITDKDDNRGKLIFLTKKGAPYNKRQSTFQGNYT